MQRVEVVVPVIKRGYRNVKIPLDIEVYRHISETVRRFEDLGLWRITLYQLFVEGYRHVERCGGLENFVEQIYEKKKLKKEAKKGMGESHDK
jgi:hypothetical protein